MNLILMILIFMTSVFAQVDSVYVLQNVYTGVLVKQTPEYVIIKSETGAENLLMRNSVTRMVLRTGEIVFSPKLNREYGKNLIITLYSGSQIKGELLVLTEIALYLASNGDSDDMVMYKIQYDAIHHIKIMNESHLLFNTGMGGIGGSLLGLLTTDSGDAFASVGIMASVGLGAMVGGISNLLVMDMGVQFSELDQEELDNIVIKLGKFARFRPVPNTTSIPAINFPGLQSSTPMQEPAIRQNGGQKMDRFRVRVGTLYHSTNIKDNYNNLFTESGFDKHKPPSTGRYISFGNPSGTTYPVVSRWRPSFNFGLDYMMTDRFFVGAEFWSKSGSVAGRDTYSTTETGTDFLGVEYDYIEDHEVIVLEEHKVSSTFLYVGYRYKPEHLIINQFGFSIGAGLSSNSIYHFIDTETRSSLLFEYFQYGGIAFTSIDWYASPSIAVSIIPQINFITSQRIPSYDWIVDDNHYGLPTHSVPFGGYNVNFVLGFSF